MLNIRPLVRLNTGHLLTELQKKADPLGYRVFGRLRDAVRSMLGRGKVFALGLDPKDRIRNETVISFEPGLASVTSAQDLEDPVRRWNDELLPELVTAEGRAVPGVVGRLAEKVLALSGDGVAAFRFGDLITELKGDARRRWEGIWKGYPWRDRSRGPGRWDGHEGFQLALPLGGISAYRGLEVIDRWVLTEIFGDGLCPSPGFARAHLGLWTSTATAQAKGSRSGNQAWASFS